MRFGQPPRLLPLPPLGETPDGVFWRPNPEFIKELVGELAGKKVLEIFAGNGYLAGLLNAEGVAVTATSLLSSMDAHEFGVYHPVTNLDARDAVAAFGSDHDVLLMCWPTVTRAAVEACLAWGDKPILFIGEYTDYSKNHLGGCATDDFFSIFTPDRELDAYRGNMLERATVGKIGLSKLDRRSPLGLA